MAKKELSVSQVGGFEKVQVSPFHRERANGVTIRLVDALVKLSVGEAISVPMAPQNAATICRVTGYLLTRRYVTSATSNKTCVVSRIA